MMRRCSFLLVPLVSLAALVLGPVPVAQAHNVVCTNSPQDVFFNWDPAPGRAVIQGATIIDCTPTAPDAQRTKVQLQWINSGWKNRGEPYISFSNARVHRVYDSTTCIKNDSDNWRTWASHTGTHGDTATTVRIGDDKAVWCYFNV